MKNIREFERMIAKLDEQLKPVAKRPFDFNDPDFAAKLFKTPDPLDETGLRAQMETLITEITAYYADCEPGERQSIRSFFEKYDSAAWAATFLQAPLTAEGIRRQLLLFSILDQGKDTRDAILWLRDITARAESAGILVKPLLEEIAGISSQINKYGMGSTRDILLHACL